MIKSENPLFAFVLMPFDKTFDDVYKVGIQETAKDFNIIAERVDEQIYTESILERILRQIDNADLIIADMTSRNPNVFYEVGYAHARSKLCTLITQDTKDIPFDLAHHRHLEYSSIIQLKSALAREFEWVAGEISKSKSQIFDVKFSCLDPVLEDANWRVDGRFDLRVTIRNSTDRRTPEIDALHLITSRDWKFVQDGAECAWDDIPDSGLRQHIIQPKVRRIAPSAFAQVTVSGTRRFWSRLNGEEKREDYSARGEIRLELATSEGVFPFSEVIDVDFEEFPF